MSSIELLSPTEIRELAARAGIRPTKPLGQNFVLDGGTVRKIVRQADVVPGRPRRRGRPGPGLADARAARGRAPTWSRSRSTPCSRACCRPPCCRHVPGLTLAGRRRRRPGGPARRRRPRPADHRARRTRSRCARCPALRPWRSSRTCPTTSPCPSCSRSSSGSTRSSACSSWCRPRWPTGWRRRPGAAPTGCRPPRPPGTPRRAGRRPWAGPCSGRPRTWTPRWSGSTGASRRRRRRRASRCSRSSTPRSRSAARCSVPRCRRSPVPPTRPSRRSRRRASTRRRAERSSTSRRSPGSPQRSLPLRWLPTGTAPPAATWQGGAVTLTPVAPLPEHEVRVRAPGKVNLSLRVGPLERRRLPPALDRVPGGLGLRGGRRDARRSDRTLTVSGPQAELRPDGRPRTSRSGRPRLLAARAGIDDGVHLHLHKGVPVAGGMAGGSADAAAALARVRRCCGARA